MDRGRDLERHARQIAEADRLNVLHSGSVLARRARVGSLGRIDVRRPLDVGVGICVAAPARDATGDHRTPI